MIRPERGVFSYFAKIFRFEKILQFSGILRKDVV